jgi:hypothetical protein
MTQEELAAQQAAEAAAQAGETKKEETPPKKEEKLLTQEEVNAIVQGKVNKLKDKYGDYDDLKTRVEAFEKAQKEKADAELSELERAQKALEAKDTTLSDLQKQIESMRIDNEKKSIRAAFEKAARGANIEYVEDAISLADLSTVVVEGDEVKGIDEIIANLVEKKPFLLAPKQGQKGIGGASNGGESKKNDVSAEELLKAAAEKARKSGRLEDRIAYVNLKHDLGK